MGCLYCGKEIGAFRLLRGDEFCTPAHRKLYGDRLGKALGRMSEAEPIPIGMAGFTLQMPLQEGNRRLLARADAFLANTHSIETGSAAGVTITPLLGTTAKRLTLETAPPADGTRARLSPEPMPIAIRLTNYFPDRLAKWNGVGDGYVAAPPTEACDTAIPPAPRSLLKFSPLQLPSLPDKADNPEAPSGRPLAQSAPGAVAGGPIDSPAPRPSKNLLASGGLRLPAMSDKPDAPLGQLLAQSPATGTWMPGPAPIPAAPNGHTASAAALAGNLIPNPGPTLPQFTEFAIFSPCVEPSARLQRSPAPEFACMPAKPRASFIPMEAAAAASIALRYPDIASLQPAEELPKEVRVGPPAGFLTSPAPFAAEPPSSRAAAAPQPILHEQAVAISMPVAPLAILGGAMRLPEAALAAAAIPSVVAPAAAASAKCAEPVAWERPTEQFSGSADFKLATQASPMPFVAARGATVASPSPASSMPGVDAIAWPLPALAGATSDLQLAKETTLAPLAACPAPSPVESLPVIPEFNPLPMAVRPGDYALLLPEIVHRPLSAQPIAAPAQRVAQFPRVSNAKSRSATCALMGPSLRLPKYAPTRPAGDAETKTLVPRAVSFLPSRPAPEAQPIETVPAAALPEFSSSDRAEMSEAAFDPAFPKPIQPAAAGSYHDMAVLKPISTLPANPAAIEAECTASAVPAPSFIPVEFYLQRAAASPRWTPGWMNPPATLAKPPFILPLIEDRSEDPVVTRPAETVPSTVTEIFSHPDAKRLAHKRLMGNLLKAAACLLVAFFVWFGTHVMSVSSQHLMANRSIGPAPASGPDVAPAPLNGEPKGFFARAQQAIARRAAVELADNFKGGMESWGAGAKGWAPGWSRNAAGYVNLGSMELFQPSMKFTDYRLEFFGQIESKGMGWVMRGRDKQNYYAMKFQVIQAGLRPVISMVHYPVTDGVKGHRVETPLNIMVHHNEPFRVSVDVSGNRFTASVEGQKIDSWTDDAPPAGGAGFFTEASERARLYWMKVTKNDDWLGVFCGFLAGDSAREVAEVWGPGIPQDGPVPPTPAGLPDVILAETGSVFDEFGGRQFRGQETAKTLMYGRRSWNS